ncbi:MAG TPA: Cys-tRNA(Pro) deacylase [Fusibacter sp.]|nr:Cys-tRNA(Pro) deacylase [Fusibacter sp.]
MSDKTNAVRKCESAGLDFELFTYDSGGEAVDGKSVADMIGKAYHEVFKTLVTVGSSGEHYVFVIPVDSALDLKKAAKTVGEKSIEMLPLKLLLSTTGYVKGGCSPIGMKKHFKTVFDEMILLVDQITFSAGRIGLQICMDVSDLSTVIVYDVADVTT